MFQWTVKDNRPVGDERRTKDAGRNMFCSHGRREDTNVSYAIIKQCEIFSKANWSLLSMRQSGK